MQAPVVTYVGCFTGKLGIFEIISRKRRGKHAAGHCVLHNLTMLVSVVGPASLNVQLGAP